MIDTKFFNNPFAVKWKVKLAKLKDTVLLRDDHVEVEDEPLQDNWTDRPEYGKDGLPSE